MGWASGSELAESVWLLIREYVPEEKRPRVAKQLIEAFRDHDWDTVDEAETLAADAWWFNEAEYDAICVDPNDPEETDTEETDTEYPDDENPTPK